MTKSEMTSDQLYSRFSRGKPHVTNRGPSLSQAEMQNVLNRQAGGMNRNFNVTPSGPSPAEQIRQASSRGIVGLANRMFG